MFVFSACYILVNIQSVDVQNLSNESTIENTINNKNLPNNFNQEKMIKIQLNDLEREKERISRKRESDNLFLEK